jgi:hypothetical protein
MYLSSTILRAVDARGVGKLSGSVARGWWIMLSRLRPRLLTIIAGGPTLPS